MRVFVSYAREDHEQVEAIKTDLDVGGHEVWFDQELTGGQSWWDAILTEIEQCDVFLLAASEASLASEACRREWTYALGWHKPVLPVICRPDVDFEMAPDPLPSINYVSYLRGLEGDKGEAIALLRSLRTAEGGPRPETPPPRPPVPLSYVVELKSLVETDGTLDLGQQLLILHRIEEKLDDLANRSRLEKLLSQLRRRPDLLASVVPHLEGLLAKVRTPSDGDRTEPERRPEPDETTEATEPPPSTTSSPLPAPDAGERHRTASTSTTSSSGRPAAAPRARREPSGPVRAAGEIRTRDDVKTFARANEADTTLVCPFCDDPVKAKNLVRHFDGVHATSAVGPTSRTAPAPASVSPSWKPSYFVPGTVPTSHGDDQTVVLAAMQRHAALPRLDVGPMIPARRIGKVLNSFDLAPGEVIVATFDHTLLGTGGIFTAVTTRRLLYRNGDIRHTWDLSALRPSDVKLAKDEGSSNQMNLWIRGDEIYWNTGDSNGSVEALRDVVRSVGTG